MKITSHLVWTTVIAVIAASQAAPAQHAGFQIGIAQPTVAFPPTPAPAIATRGTFVANPLPIGSGPIVIIQNQVLAPNPVFIRNQVFVPNPGFVSIPGFAENPVFLPNPVFNPGPTFIPTPFAFPGQVFNSNQIPSQVIVPDHILVPGQTVVSGPTVWPVGPVWPVGQSMLPPVQSTAFGPPPVNQQVVLPIPGTTRAEVLRQLGQPSVTVTTRTGETLFFEGGKTITLENGQVTGAK